jgi:NAD(P)-dependent dehydrogenase (short-subunit alcohol dehydrogenase family)
MDHLGKTALVTGSTSGIGLRAAHAFAKRGINIVVTGLGDEDLVSNILTDIRRYEHPSFRQLIARSLVSRSTDFLLSSS